PNLRKKSFRCIGEGIKKLTGLGVQVALDIPARERRVCFTYGLVAAVGSFSVLGFAVAKIGSLLIEQSQPVALMLFTGLLGRKLRFRFRKFFGRTSGPSDLSDDDEDFDTPLPPESAGSRTPELAESRTPKPAESGTPKPAESGTPEPAGSKTSQRAESRKKERSESKKRKRRAWKGRIELAVLAGLIVAIMFVGRMELRIAGPFSVLPKQNADGRSAVLG